MGQVPAPTAGNTTAGGDKPLKIVAMGDSYMSGEGATTFYQGTDLPGTNTCHRAPTAFPVLVAQELEATMPPEWGYSGVDLTFVACSGAETINIGTEFLDGDAVTEAQFAGAFGQLVQISALAEHLNADIVIIGLGGNDAHFAEVVRTCSGRVQGCQQMAEPWLNRLDAGALAHPYAADVERYVMQGLLDVYLEARKIAPEAAMYTTTYPDPLSVESCDHVGLDEAETEFLTNYFLTRLNSEVNLAANLSRVRVIDLFDAFDGTGLCAGGPDRDGPAMNGFKWQKTAGIFHKPADVVSIMQGSMHPTEAGHRIIADIVGRRIMQDLEVKHSGPPQSPVQVGPEEADLPPFGLPDGLPLPPDAPPGPRDGPTGPPPDPVGTPNGLWTMRDNDCATQGSTFQIVDRVQGDVMFTDVLPGTRVCSAEFAQPFKTTIAPAAGAVVIQESSTEVVSGLGGRRDTIYHRTDGNWVLSVEMPPPGTPEPGMTEIEAWLGVNARGWGIAIAVSVVLILVGVGVVVDNGLVHWRRRREAARS